MKETDRKAFAIHATLNVFKSRVERAKASIAEALTVAPAYVACSWGKDSVALLHLTQQVMPDVPVIFFVAAEQEMLDNYQATIEKYRTLFPTNYLELDLVGDRVPDKVKASNVWELYPMALIGLRAEESVGRRMSLRKHGLIHQFKTGAAKESWRACPLAWWSWRDVWAYTIVNNLPYLTSYDHWAQESYQHSRTCNLLAKKNTKGTQWGRIAILKQRAPEYYQYLQLHYPEIASAT